MVKNYRIISIQYNTTIHNISYFINITLNKIGPIILLWGTPYVIGHISDLTLFNLTPSTL